MFKLVRPESVKWPVSVDVPANGGQTTNQKFTATIKLIGREELTRLAMTDESELIRKTVIGWEDVDAEFSPENLETLIDTQHVAIGLARAIVDCHKGRRQGN